MKRTHRWAAMIAALMLAAGLVLPTIASAGEDSILYPGEKPKKLVAPWSFGDPDTPVGRSSRAPLIMLKSTGFVVLLPLSGRVVVVNRNLRSMTLDSRRR